MHLTKEQNQHLDNLISNLLYFFSNSSKKITTNDLFNKIWEIVYHQILISGSDQDIALKEIATTLYGPYQLNIRELLLLKIVDIFRKNNIIYTPNIIAKDGAILNQIKLSSEPAIFVSTHNGFAHNIKLLTYLGRKVTTIGLPSYTNLALNRSGIASNVNIVNQDSYCLAYIKKDIANGALISSTVDFKLGNESFKYISPALFDFSKRINAALYFSRSEVLADGKVELHFQLSSNSALPEESANQFIQYCATSLSQKSLVVKDFQRA